MGAQPEEDEHHEGDPVCAVQVVAVGQEVEPCASIAGRPLVAEQVLGPNVLPSPRLESALVQDILGIGLYQCERFLDVPGPVRRVERFAALVLLAGE